MNPFAGGKLWQHADRVAEWCTDGDCAPVTAEIDLTNVCTDRCPQCVGGRAERKAMLDATTAMHVIDEMALLGVRGVIFTGGGDPFCHPDAAGIIQHASRQCAVGVITNGVLLDMGRDWDSLWDTEWVRVSLDAHNAEAYRKTHGTENFARVLQNVKAFVERKREMGSGPDIGIGSLVAPDTAPDMPKVAALCAGLGVDYVQFRPYHQCVELPGYAQKAQAGFRAAQEYQRKGFSVTWSAHKYEAMLRGDAARQYGECYGHCLAAVVAADGEVYLCCHMRGNKNYSFGNIHDEPLSSIWHGERRQRVIRQIDFARCPTLCRCDPMNRQLWDIKHNAPTHKDFL